jgi:hypothetical protein
MTAHLVLILFPQSERQLLICVGKAAVGGREEESSEEDLGRVAARSEPPHLI